MSEERRIQFMLSDRGGISECPPVQIKDSYYLDKNTKHGSAVNSEITYYSYTLTPDSWKIDFGEYQQKSYTEIHLDIGYTRVFALSSTSTGFSSDFQVDTVEYPDFNPTDVGYYPRTIYFEMVDSPLFLIITQNGNSYLGYSQINASTNLFTGDYCDVFDKNMRTIFPDYRISFSNYNDWILLQ